MAKFTAAAQLSLGELITQVEKLPSEELITILTADSEVSPGRLRSYRGDYAELAIEPSDKPRTAADFLGELKAAIGKTFHGYKGGEYVMGEYTYMYLAEYGSTGPALCGGLVTSGAKSEETPQDATT